MARRTRGGADSARLPRPRAAAGCANPARTVCNASIFAHTRHSHTHTQFGTPWSANVEPFRALSQESTAFVFDQALFDDEEVEVLSTDGGKRIAASLGDAKLCILRNHGLLSVGRTVEEAVGWFVMAERVAEVHVKAPNGQAISDEAATIAADTMAMDLTGWRVFQWLRRSLPDN